MVNNNNQANIMIWACSEFYFQVRLYSEICDIDKFLSPKDKIEYNKIKFSIRSNHYICLFIINNFYITITLLSVFIITVLQ